MTRQKCLVVFACLVLHFTNAQYFDEKPDVPFGEGSAPTKGYLPPQVPTRPSNAYLPVEEGAASNPQDKYLPPEDKVVDGTDVNPNVLIPPRDEKPEAAEPNQVKIQPQLGCSAALLCVEEQYCTMSGVISKTPVSLTEDQMLRRVPMIDCRNPENGVVGKCCRDPDYSDPWPNGGNLPPNYKGGFDENGFPKIFNYNYTNTKEYNQNAPKPGRPGPQRPLPTPSIEFNRPTFPQGAQQQPTFARPTVPQQVFNKPVPSQPTFPNVGFPQPSGPSFIGSGSNALPNQIPTYGNEKHDEGESLSPSQALPSDIYKLPGAVNVQPNKPYQRPIENIQNVIDSDHQGYPSEQNSVYPSKVSPSPTTQSQNKQPVSGIKEIYNPAPPLIAPHQPGSQCGLINKVQSAYGLNEAEVPFGAIPWQAMILSNSQKKLLCSGAIIAPNAVLTSAACVYGYDASDVSAKSGEWKLGYELKHEEPLPFEIVQVQKIFSHPNFQQGVAGYDMAVLILEKPFKLDLHVDTICLGNAPTMITPQKKCISTGWGKTIIQIHAAGALMNKIDVSLMDENECRNRLQGAESPLSLDESLMCAKATYKKNNMCQVDLGGPLACDRGDGFYEIIGVYSQDTGCLPTNQVATFAMIDYPWIHSVLNGGPSKPSPTTFEYEGPAPYLGQPSNQPQRFQSPSPIHYHQPGVPCDCREGSAPAGLHQYLPPQ